VTGYWHAGNYKFRVKNRPIRGDVENPGSRVKYNMKMLGLVKEDARIKDILGV